MDYLIPKVIGQWQDNPFVAGNFTGKGAMTWTVALGNVVTNRYRIDADKTLEWILFLAGSTIGGALNNALFIAFPLGSIAKKLSINTIYMVDGNGTQLIGYGDNAMGDNFLTIGKPPSANFTAGANASVGFHYVVELQ
jgi:hypothetical protein